MEKTKADGKRTPALLCGSAPRFHRPRFLRSGYLRNSASFLLFTGLYTAINVTLFGLRVWQYRDRSLLEQVARGTGFCLNFDSAVVLVLVLRRLLTWLRSCPFGQLLPLEHHIYLHKMAGWSVYVLSIAHTLFHLANFVNMSYSSGVTVQDYLFDTSMGIGWFVGSANITGIALLIILTVMVICSHRAVRRSGYFEIFYWTHLLSIPTWVLLILHSPNFWKWFLVPGVLFAAEVACRISRVCSDRGRSLIASATLLPSEVVRLNVARPVDFCFHPGDFCYVNVPAVAKYEWHPFTISSSPEDQDEITFHIRAVGEWTRSLHDKVLDACLKSYLYDQFVLMKATTTAGIPAVAATLAADYETKPASPVIPSRPENEYVETRPMPQRKISRPMYLRRMEWLRRDRANSTSSTRTMISRSEDDDCEEQAHDNLAFTRDVEQDPEIAESVKTATKGCISDSQGASPVSSDTKDVEELGRQPNRSSVRVLWGESGSGADRGAIGERGSVPDRISLGCAAQDSGTTGESAGANSDCTYVPSGYRASPRYRLAQNSVKAMRTGDSAATQRRERKNLQHSVVDKLNWKVILDGPYGAPSTSVFHSQHAVLIGGGIGVTPFASVLHCIVDRYNAAHQPCPHCQVPTCLQMPSSMLKLKKVDFVWVNRDMRSFEWFLELLHELRASQQRRGSQLESFLTIQLYKTSSMPIAGPVPLRNEVKQGRPDWDKVFAQIADRKAGKVTVFYCGPPALGNVIREKAAKFSFGFLKEKF